MAISTWLLPVGQLVDAINSVEQTTPWIQSVRSTNSRLYKNGKFAQEPKLGKLLRELKLTPVWYS